jgi:predicted nuclease of predicted toxin-antitoxin system
VKLLFDQNLSFRLVASLTDLFPGSTHVGTAGLDRSTDAEIWSFAASRDFMIVSKDDDFRQLSMLRGAPPKVIWLQVGNCATSQIEQLLRRRYPAIESFSRSAESTFLIVRMDAV